MTNYQTYLLGFCAAMTGQKLNSEENLSEAELCAFALGLRDGSERHSSLKSKQEAEAAVKAKLEVSNAA